MKSIKVTLILIEILKNMLLYGNFILELKFTSLNLY